jgi:hypothetical protein
MSDYVPLPDGPVATRLKNILRLYDMAEDDFNAIQSMSKSQWLRHENFGKKCLELLCQHLRNNGQTVWDNEAERRRLERAKELRQELKALSKYCQCGKIIRSRAAKAGPAPTAQPEISFYTERNRQLMVEIDAWRNRVTFLEGLLKDAGIDAR